MPCDDSMIPPVVPLAASAFPAVVGVSVTVQATGGRQQYVWSAPGGTPSSGTGSTFTTTYTANGTYTITVTSGTRTGSLVVTVVDADPPSPPPAPPPPTATTGVATSVTRTTVTLVGTGTPNGLSTVGWFDYGVTTSYGSTTAEQDLGAGTSAVAIAGGDLTGLTCNTTYHFRAHTSQPSTGHTGQGADATVTTSACAMPAPLVVTQAASSVIQAAATLNGTVDPEGSPTTGYFEYGLTTSYGSTTAVEDVGTGSTAVALAQGAVTGLTCNTTYHFRAVGINAAGTTNGSDLTLTTASCSPTAVTGASSAVTETTATIAGTGNPNGVQTNGYFDYGLTTAYGAVTADQDLGSGSSPVAIAGGDLTGLTCNTLYHFRAATLQPSNGHTGTGSDATFTTSACGVPPAAPTVVTSAASSVGQTSATLAGTVDPEGSPSVGYFEWGTTVAYGQSTAHKDLGAGSSPVAITGGALTGLTCNTTYHFRAVGTNAAGTSTGSDLTFTTSACSPTAPTATTGVASAITQTTATLAGTGTPNGTAANGYFDYGLTTSYGSTTASQSLGSGSSPVAIAGGAITGLTCNTTYHFRARTLQPSTGQTGTGSDATFTTSACPVAPTLPTVVTSPATAIGQAVATLQGTVDPEGSPTTGYFQYGLTTGYGATTAVENMGTGSTAIALAQGAIIGLACNTTYHFRAVGVNAAGTTNGSDRTFTTAACSPPPVPGTRSVLTQSDLAYLGRFRLPFSTPGAQGLYGRGIGIRYEGGTPHFLFLNSRISEWSMPALTSSGVPNTATLLKDYGAVPASLLIDQNGTAFAATVYGMHFDAISDRLYVTYGHAYNSGVGGSPGLYPNNPSFLAFDLNYAAGTKTGSGPWRLSGVGCKAIQSGALTIPTYFANTYTAGQTLGLGVGGIFAVLSSGGVSMGPSLFAIAPPTTEPASSQLANTPLLNFNPTRFLRGATTPAFENRFDSLPITRWTWDPVLAGAWVYSNTKHGVIYLAHVTAGVGDYAISTLWFQEGKHRWYVFDPDDLANVATGSVSADAVPSDSFWDVQYPGVDYSTYPIGPAPVKSVSSLTRSGTVATATVTAHGYLTNDVVLIGGANQAAYNLVTAITKIDANTFTFGNVAGSPTTPATGTITAQKMATPYPAPFGSTPRGGITFDAATRRVYVAVPVPFSGSTYMTVYVWEIPGSSSPAGSVISVTAGQNLQTAVDAAPAGATLVLANNATFSGRLTVSKRLTFKPATAVAAGRVSPAAGLPRILGGIDITGSDVTFQGGIAVSSSTPGDTLIVDQGVRTRLFQVSVEGSSANGQHRGIEANGQDGIYRECYVDNIWEVGRDAQAICGWDGTSNLLIDDCYLGASGQSVMFGGADSASLPRMPRNVTLMDSTLSKTPSWKSVKNAQTKTALELKAISGFTARNNLLQYSGSDDGQGGFAMVLTVRNQDGNAPWSIIEDVLIEDNEAQYHSGLVSILGTDDAQTSEVMTNVVIRNLSARNIDGTGYPGNARLIQMGHGADRVVIDTITFLTTPLHLDAVAYFYDDPPTLLQVSNITSPASTYGWFVDAQGSGLSVVQLYAPDAVFTNVTE